MIQVSAHDRMDGTGEGPEVVAVGPPAGLDGRRPDGVPFAPNPFLEASAQPWAVVLVARCGVEDADEPKGLVGPRGTTHILGTDPPFFNLLRLGNVP